MSDAQASILPRKIGNKAPNRAKSAFSPDMLRAFCEVAGEALGDLLDARVRVTLDSVGLEPYADVAPAEDAVFCGAVVSLNGNPRAATLMPDDAALFHLVDIMLGGDASQDESVVARAPSALNDRFCKTVIRTMIRALVEACDAGIGPGSCLFDGEVEIAHDREALTIAAPGADVMAIELKVSFGMAERAGRFTLHVPLATVDAISGAGGGNDAQPVYESGPWFDHMKTSVSLMELDTIALLHTEQMTLAALSRLDIGSVIPVDIDAISKVTITLEDGGDVIATGELGTSSGRRVVSLSGHPNAAFLAPMRKLLK